MVSSDFGKLEVSRHLICGADWATAGFAMAAAARPAPAALINCRRFMDAPVRSGNEPPEAAVWRCQSRLQPQWKAHEPARSACEQCGACTCFAGNDECVTARPAKAAARSLRFRR